MDRIQSALSFIPADDRETWVSMAMALRSEHDDEEAFDVWDRWSQSAGNYNASAARSVWRSCRGRGITLGSLFHAAKGYGWRDDQPHSRPSQAALDAHRRDLLARQTREGQQREREQQQAARKGAWIMHQCVQEQHAYLDSKGYPDLKGAVWRPSPEQNLLCIPMRVDGALVGIQMIDRFGSKKYLTGQRTSEAEYVIDNSGTGAKHFYVEGYATGLSLRDCLKSMSMRYVIHVTFSAGNLVKVAAKHGTGLVIADQDASGTGQKAGAATGLPVFLPPTEGQDFNDLHRATSTFRAAQALRKWMASLCMDAAVRAVNGGIL